MTDASAGPPTAPPTPPPTTAGPPTAPPTPQPTPQPTPAERGPARHERPTLDALGLEAARRADHLLAAAREAAAAGRPGAERWVTYLELIPDHLRDDEPSALRRTAVRARSAYGPKDSIREVLPWDLTEPFLDALDRLIRELNRTRA